MAVPDLAAEKQGMVRIVDESEEDYLYSKSLFGEIALPDPPKKAVLAV